MRKIVTLVFTFVLGVCCSAGQVIAEEAMVLVAESGPTQTALVELYTSEGCSSCPAAEQWFSALKKAPKLWKNFVPVAFHVDFWDHLGWVDRLGSAEFSKRIRRYAVSGQGLSVYTPAFFLQGYEWKGWYRGAAVPPASTGLVAGSLRAYKESHLVTVHYESPPHYLGQSWEAHAVLMGFGIEVDIENGENAGKHLVHDFAVLAHATQEMREVQSGVYEIKLWVKDEHEGLKPSSYGLAVWVTRKGTEIPIQAAGGWL